MLVSETRALPLGDTPIALNKLLNDFKVAGVRGFEPRNAGIRIRCLTAWRYPNFTLTISYQGQTGGLAPGDTPTSARTAWATFKIGWGTRIRTSECWYQKPEPYRLAIPQQFFWIYRTESIIPLYGGYDGIRTCDPIIMSDVL